MTNTRQQDIISYHWSWINSGFGFDAIKAVHYKITYGGPFSYNGIADIQHQIGGQLYPLPTMMQESDYEKFSYIFYNEHGFDGNLEFLEKWTNIEQISIGCACCGTIENLKPLEKLTKLKFLDLDRHNISDLSSLSKLSKLETLILWGNPIKSIKPIVHLQNLKNVQFSVVEEDEIFELLKNSTDATVTYVSTENDESYKAVWINGWAFRTKSYKDLTTISITVEPLLITAFLDEVRASGTDYISLMRQKSENIALSLQSDTHVMESSTEHFHEDVRFLKVFEYKLK
ncbi:MAG: hypothetical protein V4547_03340 [Bacteroidota bacterium]